MIRCQTFNLILLCLYLPLLIQTTSIQSCEGRENEFVCTGSRSFIRCETGTRFVNLSCELGKSCKQITKHTIFCDEEEFSFAKAAAVTPPTTSIVPSTSPFQTTLSPPSATACVEGTTNCDNTGGFTLCSGGNLISIKCGSNTQCRATSPVTIYCSPINTGSNGIKSWKLARYCTQEGSMQCSLDGNLLVCAKGTYSYFACPANTACVSNSAACKAVGVGPGDNVIATCSEGSTICSEDGGTYQCRNGAYIYATCSDGQQCVPLSTASAYCEVESRIGVSSSNLVNIPSVTPSANPTIPTIIAPPPPSAPPPSMNAASIVLDYCSTGVTLCGSDGRLLICDNNIALPLNCPSGMTCQRYTDSIAICVQGSPPPNSNPPPSIPPPSISPPSNFPPISPPSQGFPPPSNNPSAFPGPPSTVTPGSPSTLAPAPSPFGNLGSVPSPNSFPPPNSVPSPNLVPAPVPVPSSSSFSSMFDSSVIQQCPPNYSFCTADGRLGICNPSGTRINYQYCALGTTCQLISPGNTAICMGSVIVTPQASPSSGTISGCVTGRSYCADVANLVVCTGPNLGNTAGCPLNSTCSNSSLFQGQGSCIYHSSPPPPPPTPSSIFSSGCVVGNSFCSNGRLATCTSITFATVTYCDSLSACVATNSTYASCVSLVTGPPPSTVSSSYPGCLIGDYYCPSTFTLAICTGNNMAYIQQCPFGSSCVTLPDRKGFCSGGNAPPSGTPSVPSAFSGTCTPGTSYCVLQQLMDCGPLGNPTYSTCNLGCYQKSATNAACITQN